MNARAHMPQNLRDEMESWYDCRYRANTLGEIQMLFTGIYFLLLGFMVDESITLIKNSSSQLNQLYTDVEEIDKKSITLDGILIRLSILKSFLQLHAKTKQLMFWTALRVMIALLHILSSLLLMKATEQETPKLRAIMFCKWVQLLNYIFFVVDVAVFVFGSVKLDIIVLIFLYHLVFNFHVKGCLKTIESLAPSPPGHN